MVGEVTVSWCCPYCEGGWEQGEETGVQATSTGGQAVISYSKPAYSHASAHLNGLIEVFQTPLLSSSSGHPDLADPAPPSLPPDPLPRPSFLTSSLSSLASSTMENAYFHPINLFRRAIHRSNISANPHETRLLDSLVREFEDMRAVPSLLRRSQMEAERGRGRCVERLKVTKEMEARQESCPICQEVFCRPEEFTALPCVHLFHWECLGEWLRAKRSCPVCRVAVDV